MPKLIKIETDASVSEYTPPSGYATLFYAVEEGKTVLKVKTASGAIETVSGSTGGSTGGGTAAVFPSRTFGVATTSSADWTTAANLVTVAAGTSLYINTIKVVDSGGDGGEIRLLLSDGTNTYQLDAVTIEANDSLDLSPAKPYAIEAGWSLLYQSKGGAGIHITMTGSLGESAKTFGAATPANADWATAVSIATVSAGTRLDIATVKLADTGGDGGEIRLLLSDGTNTYYLDAVTIEANDSLDLSPLEPYAIEAGWSLLYQSKGGAGIHLTLTGSLREIA